MRLSWEKAYINTGEHCISFVAKLADASSEPVAIYQNPYARQGANFQIDGLRFELFCDNALVFFKYSFIFALPACMKTVKPLAGVDTYVLPVALLPLSLLLTPRQPARPKHRRIRNPGLKCAASRLE